MQYYIADSAGNWLCKEFFPSPEHARDHLLKMVKIPPAALPGGKYGGTWNLMSFDSLRSPKRKLEKVLTDPSTPPGTRKDK